MRAAGVGRPARSSLSHASGTRGPAWPNPSQLDAPEWRTPRLEARLASARQMTADGHAWRLVRHEDRHSDGGLPHLTSALLVSEKRGARASSGLSTRTTGGEARETVSWAKRPLQGAYSRLDDPQGQSHHTLRNRKPRDARSRRQSTTAAAIGDGRVPNGYISTRWAAP